jgi:HEPN domain-containing protein
VTNRSLAQSYLVKAQKRLKALAVLRDEGAHSDVVREAQELVELALKGMLRRGGYRAAQVSRRGRPAPRARGQALP